MRYILLVLLPAAWLSLGIFRSASCEIVTSDEAQQIAANWAAMITSHTGGWNGQTNATIAEVAEFRSDDRLLGYYCTVEPSGYIIVSAVKGLAPVKVYSPTSRLDLEATAGPTTLLEFQMERLIREVELQVGPVAKVTPEEVDEISVYKNVGRLEMLSQPTDEFLRDLSRDRDKQDYLEEGILLSSHWHQGNPYNIYVPAGSNGCTEDNCAVGCVATAAAQIMRYWSWPPGSQWDQRPDYIDASSSSEHIDAVATLCSNIGVWVGMDYCSDECMSSVPTSDMVQVYDDWHYVECSVAYRGETSQDTWWQLAKAHVSVNEPIQYRIVNHSIVLDGWREWFSGSYNPEYHMNYGWDDAATAWYEIDHLLQVADGASWEDEYMLVGIYPGMSLHSSVSGPVIQLPFNYRYVNRDCTGSAADFYPGQFIQFLPGVSLVCTRTWMKFTGLPGETTRLYTPVPERGIRIDNGTMVFYPGGGIRFQQSRPGP